MIVTPKQLAAMRAGRITVGRTAVKVDTVYMPASRVKEWRVGRRVALRKMLEREEENLRTSIPLIEQSGRDQGAQVAITVTAIGEPCMIEDVDLRAANRAGFKTLGDLRQYRSDVFTSRERRDAVVPIRFEMVTDRPKLLAPGPRRGKFQGDYTRSQQRAMADEPEVLV